MDAVPDEDDRRVKLRRWLAGLILGNELRAIFKVDGLTALLNEREPGFVLESVDGKERDALEVGAVVARGFHAVQGKLSGDVFGGEFRSARAGAAAFKQ